MTYQEEEWVIEPSEIPVRPSELGAFMANEPLLQIDDHPTQANPGRGLYAPMASRIAIERFCRAASDRGLRFKRLPSQAEFGFANSQ